VRFFVLCSVSMVSLTSYASSSIDEWELFRSYSLSSCIATHYEGESIYQDAIDALNGYREFGNLPLEAYHEVTTFIESHSPKKYRSKSGNISELTMCIDIQDSSAIKDIYDKYSKS
jgi:hypothetical protein